MLSEERKKEIRERLEKATPGPWDYGASYVYLNYGLEFIKVATTEHPKAISNAALIAHAPTDIRDLLTALEKMEAELARTREKLRFYAVSQNEPGSDNPAAWCDCCDTAGTEEHPESHRPVTLTINGVETTGPCPARKEGA